MTCLDLLRAIVVLCEKRLVVQRRICARFEELAANDAAAPVMADEAYLELLDAEERLLRAQLEVQQAEDL